MSRVKFEIYFLSAILAFAVTGLALLICWIILGSSQYIETIDSCGSQGRFFLIHKFSYGVINYETTSLNYKIDDGDFDLPLIPFHKKFYAKVHCRNSREFLITTYPHVSEDTINYKNLNFIINR